MSTKSTLIGLLILAIIVIAIVLLSKPANKANDMTGDDYQNIPSTTTPPAATPANQLPPAEEPVLNTEPEVVLPTTGVQDGQ